MFALLIDFLKLIPAARFNGLVSLLGVAFWGTHPAQLMSKTGKEFGVGRTAVGRVCQRVVIDLSVCCAPSKLGSTPMVGRNFTPATLSVLRISQLLSLALYRLGVEIFSRACETIDGTRGVQMRRFVSKRISFFSNKRCLSNFREPTWRSTLP